MARAPTLAKLSAPAVGKVLPRTRLFRELDKARKHPITWIAAPAGSGKTTLVASYVHSRKLSCLWYQVDAGDRDLASFFHYLGLAVAQAAPRFRRPLPKLTPEYLAGVAVFARNFFRELSRRVHPPFVLVLDNLHALAPEAPFHEILCEGLSELPRGGHAVLISRTDPPEAYARMRANRQLTQPDWQQLRLSETESRALVRLLGRKGQVSSGAEIESLHRRCEGWLAGLILLLEGSGKGTQQARTTETATTQTLFDYFAAEIFMRRPPAVREFLMSTALFPSFTADMAERLTGYTRARALLNDLVRQHHFTERRAHPSDTYQYHPLFLEFLLERGCLHYDAAERTALIKQAASMLLSAGQIDYAAELMRESGDEAALIALIEGHAPTLAAQGRLATLESWLRSLPQTSSESHPWLSYWLGACRMPFNLREARDHLKRAYDGFKKAELPLGMYLAWARIVETFFYEWDDFTPIDHWIGEIKALGRAHPIEQYPQAEPYVVQAAVHILSFVRGDDPELPRWVCRAEALLEELRGGHFYIPVTTALSQHYGWMGKTEKVHTRTLELRSYVEASDAEPLARLQGYVTLSGNWLLGDLEMAKHWAARGIEYGVTHGIRLFESVFYGQTSYTYQLSNDPEGAAIVLAQLEGLTRPERRLEVSHYHYLSTWLALERGELTDARAHAEKAVAIAETVSARFPMALCRIKLAEVLVEFGEFDAALQRLDQATDFARDMGSYLLLFTAGLVHAWAMLCAGRRKESAEVLTRALAYGRERDYTAYPNLHGKRVAALCQFALQNNIESSYVRMLIKQRGLGPPTDASVSEAWPYPVKLCTLGRFAVLIDDKPLKFSGKTQKKPLELLKTLIAFGGREVREDKLTDVLWPDAEADSAAFALTSTVHRLRKLTGEAAIERREGCLSLNPRHCWVDVWALEHQLTALELANRAPQPEVIADAADQLLVLYRGPFLNDHPEHPWVLSTRERLRGKFLRALGSAATALTQARRHDQVLRCLEKGLEVDPLAEDFYRRLMQAHLSQGHPAEALAAYHRCRTMLTNHLGLEPSADTEAVRRQIQPA